LTEVLASRWWCETGMELWMKITPESQSEIIVGFAGFPVTGAHMMVCCKGGI